MPNINLHLKAIYAEGKLAAEATFMSHLTVRLEGLRKVSRPVLRSRLPVILAVGFGSPDSQDEAVRTVFKQAELLCSGWSFD